MAEPLPESEFLYNGDVSDSSQEEGEGSDGGGQSNRVGNVPMHWYDDEDHIGYDVHGKKKAKPTQGDRIDELLKRMDDPDSSRTIYDELNGRDVVLSKEELSIIQRVRKGKFAHRGFDMYESYGDFYTGFKRIEALGNPVEPKRRFIPSKWEEKKVLKLVHAIRNGWLKLDEDKPEEKTYLLWGADAAPSNVPKKMPRVISAPKPLPPGHAESYNPPAEYIPTEEEKAQWESLDPENRPHNFIPTQHDALRAVPLYKDFIKERFERCLDLYLCPRQVRKKLNIDPESLIPRLPKPKELRPYPSVLDIEYVGHTGIIRCITVSPCGQWMASGSDDMSVRLWEVDTGRCFRTWQLEAAVMDIAWNPNPSVPLLAVAVGDQVVLLHTQTGNDNQSGVLEQLMRSAAQAAAEAAEAGLSDNAGKWSIMQRIDCKIESQELAEAFSQEAAVSSEDDDDDDDDKENEEDRDESKKNITTARVTVDVGTVVRKVVWHRKGDYFASIADKAGASAVLVHRVSKGDSRSPFKKAKGHVEKVLFHPSKPFFFVATKRHVRIYDLSSQALVRKLQCPARWISSLSLHPSGDHLLAGSYDCRVCWYDLDLSARPYKTLKYHKKAVRDVHFHSKYPLFASCSDAGKLHIFHGKVYNDLVTDPLIVPVKVLSAHEKKDTLGALACQFHPHQPWIFSAGADHSVRLWT